MKVLGVIGSVILFFVVIVILNVFDLEMFKFFAPKKENARRKVFENTQSYVEGKTQDLAKYYREWKEAKTPEDKAIIEGIVRQQFASFNADNLNSIQLQNFLTNVRGF